MLLDELSMYERDSDGLLCLGARMRNEGSYTVVTVSVCVCMCVCLFQAYILFPWTLGKGKDFYAYYLVFSNFAICRFEK